MKTEKQNSQETASIDLGSQTLNTYEVHVVVSVTKSVVVAAKSPDRAATWARSTAAPNGMMDAMTEVYDWTSVEVFEVEGPSRVDGTGETP